MTNRLFFTANAIVSAGAVAFLAWLLWVRTAAPVAGVSSLDSIPLLNACFNGISAACLTAGWFAIKRGRRELHRSLMLAAFAASVCFLIGYIAYHAVHGETRFGGVGAVRVAYLTLLASHVLLSIFVPPLALTALFFAVRGQFERHKKVTRFALPVWLYVSATGVLVYLLLHVWYAPAGTLG
jgi:putative membrane protein